jgi:uncharacterized protein YndB with AHSA1/START domain
MPGKTNSVASLPPESAADSREWSITRVFNAPRALVYKAWTDPKQMARWWGPKTFTNPVCNLDVRPGGAYRIVMRDPRGTEYPMKGVYREIIPNERIVFTCNLSEHPDSWHQMVNPSRLKDKSRPDVDAVTTVTFVEKAGKTTMTVHMLFDNATLRAAHVRLGMGQGWSESFERMDEVLAKG